ncbi:hypothetical protein [Candidatus Poriferisodalis sp.]|uniref:hypothetical protein n=1 Tax=Candidatus Poriferisodalis sp. TaxID=3101277 RepID=UPI003B0203E6
MNCISLCSARFPVGCNRCPKCNHWQRKQCRSCGRTRRLNKFAKSDSILRRLSGDHRKRREDECFDCKIDGKKTFVAVTSTNARQHDQQSSGSSVLSPQKKLRNQLADWLNNGERVTYVNEDHQVARWHLSKSGTPTVHIRTEQGWGTLVVTKKGNQLLKVQGTHEWQDLGPLTHNEMRTTPKQAAASAVTSFRMPTSRPTSREPQARRTLDPVVPSAGDKSRWELRDQLIERITGGERVIAYSAGEKIGVWKLSQKGNPRVSINTANGPEYLVVTQNGEIVHKPPHSDKWLRLGPLTEQHMR